MFALAGDVLYMILDILGDEKDYNSFEEDFLIYCYIRYLDLDDMYDLLRDPGFTGKIRDDFFAPEVLDFLSHDYASKGNKRLRSTRISPDNEWLMTRLGGEYFEVFSYSHLGPRSIEALGSHLNSLRELKLTSLSIEAIAKLPSLTAPPVLEVLVLTDSIPAPRTEEFYSTVTRVADWIRSCKALRRLSLRRFVDDSNLLSQVLTHEGPHLSSLSLEAHTMAGSGAFYEALASQQTLRNLYLRGEASEFPVDNEALVQGIIRLNNLHELELKDISDCFTINHITVLTPFLPHLERLWISGDFFNDDIWNAFLCLPNLQSLVIHALSEFTSRGILDFISRLGPGNRGFSLSILNATTDANITEEAQNLIRENLRNSLDGSFDFGLAQEEYSDMDSAEMSE
ncbi:uncharacterized protein ATNIH1004_003269 [Aspergillus tanneri]|uniref:F-box domain-containing protein n=1 Tax=Aspergillus tanneri TaxID=1220188 RepID=A0A5M9MTY2_9EURO|nr:uncharacterized protein ATNIH1004_003269 [Aspergillus tanneri]KAA8650582.1 hypothetical protein ATNIH1004_003269 [Aspergillus tanneri]